MKITRKNFLKLGGLAGIGMMFGTSQANTRASVTTFRPQKFNMHGYAAPKLETVRIGFIGVGSRGSGNVIRYASIEGVEIKALCDPVPQRVEASRASLKREFSRHNPDSYADSKDDWKKVCERNDIDMVCIGTPWKLHAPIAIYAMEHDKHVYVDLPLGVTVEECWQVVEASERTRKHCYMDSGNCHGGMAAVLLNMVRQGYFGDIIHAEGHYIHDRVSQTSGRWDRDENNWFGYRPWRLQENVNRNGNLYPGHGLGPLSQMMDLNYGDQMDYMVSVSGNDFTMADKMKELAETDDYFRPYVGLSFRGNMNTSIIRTHKGRTIMLQHDISSPRPGHRFDLISGNKGIFRASPDRIATSEHGWLPQEEFDGLREKYTPEITKRFNEKVSQAQGVRGGRSYERVSPSDWRLIDSLRNGLPLEVDVYDGALWSVITPLSEWSVAREGQTVKVPDFTGGSWRTNKRGMDISIREGGNTNLV
jgi:predicted dehydrogenase